MDVRLAPPAWKLLLGTPLGLADLDAVHPDVAHGLKSLLALPAADVAALGLTFEVEDEVFGAVRAVELVPGGGAAGVTAGNRVDYVAAYARHKLLGRAGPAPAAFVAGFRDAVGGPALSLLRPEELEVLATGLPHLDWGALRRAARYEGPPGWGEGHPTVDALWDTVIGMPPDRRKRLLRFITGCDRAPVGGLGEVPLVVQRAGPDTDRLPTASTCFATLLLPEYGSSEKLARLLTLAVENAEGFGLQ